MFGRLSLAAAAALFMVTGALAQDGARAYHLLPQGTDILSLTTTLLQGARSFEPGGEIDSSSFEALTFTPTYRGSVELFGTASTWLIALPFGTLSSTLGTPGGDIPLETDFAQGDLILGGMLGLVGSPSLTPMDYAQYRPGFRAGLATKLFLPTGAYDADYPLNLGSNRWSLQASLPLSYVLAESMIDPALTTFELTPSVRIFGDNDDAPGLAAMSSQNPLFALEGHVTRNFGGTVWASLDGYYQFGGETFADGVAENNAKDELSLGATLGLSLSPSFSLRLSYDEVVRSNVPDASGRRFELTSAYIF